MFILDDDTEVKNLDAEKGMSWKERLNSDLQQFYQYQQKGILNNISFVSVMLLF
jgi:hypothetical protein